MKQTKLRESSSFLNKDCEEFRLLELKGEYAAFIIDLESEVALLGHIIGCTRCRENIKRVIETGDHQDNWWNNLFSKELPDILGYENEIFQGKEGYCPGFEDYANMKNFIEARILWREKKLERIWSDAKVELKDIMTRLNDKTSSNFF